MFNLEQSIAAGIKTPATLEELENHLREEIQRQMKLGLNERQAFDMAAKTIGRGAELKKEFRKGEPLGPRLIKLFSIGCSTVAFIFSLWWLLILLMDCPGWMNKITGLMAVATIILAWKFNYKVLPVIPSHWIRSLAGFACCVATIIMIPLFIKYVWVGLVTRPALIAMLEKPGGLGHVLAMFLWVWTALAMLGGIGIGLERAVRKQELMA
jgi:hypothetical protein